MIETGHGQPCPVSVCGAGGWRAAKKVDKSVKYNTIYNMDKLGGKKGMGIKWQSCTITEK